MVGNARQHFTQVSFWVKVIELGAADQAVDGGSAFTAGIGAGKEIVLAAESNRTQRTFSDVVVCALKRCTAFSGEKPDRLALVPAGST